MSAREPEVDTRAVWLFAGTLAGITIVAGVLLWQLFGYFSAREAAQGPLQFPLRAGRQEQLPPAPRLQTDPRRDLQAFRAQEDALLDSYGWVDEDAGIAHVPIDEAMTLLLERGLPTRDAPAPAATSGAEEPRPAGVGPRGPE